MTPDEFRKSGHALIDLIADYRTNVEKMPVRSQNEYGELLDWLPDAPPGHSENVSVLLDEIASKVVPSMTHWQHPSFFAYFPANAELSTVLGDLASSGFGQLGLNWQSSPPLTEFEQRMCDWIRQLLGLTAQWHGVIQDSASSSTLVALLSAREKSTNFGQTHNGPRDGAELVVYSSSQAHSSVNKAALLAGFGKNQLRSCSVNADHSIDLNDLRRQLDEDIANNRKPCAIVGCTGTTATTAMDNIDGLAELAEAYGCWLHVDSAMAGSAMILPEMRHLWNGVERADSVVLNPHKWLGVVFDCSVYFVRDEQHLVRVMSTNPSYLQTAADGEAPNYRDWGIPLGRRFRAMKLWWLLRCEGSEKLQSRLRRDIENARWLEQQILAHPDWHLVAPVALQTLCVVHRPPSVSADELDDYTQAWCESINASGDAMLTPAIVAEQWIVRISIGALSTELRHVEKLWQTLQDHTR